jgi:hypothetical protein
MMAAKGQPQGNGGECVGYNNDRSIGGISSLVLPSRLGWALR